MLRLANEVFIWGADYFCQHLPSGGSWIVWDKKIGNGKIGNEFELCWSMQRHKKTIIQNEWAGFRGMEAVDDNRVHPTQKPVSLLSKIMESYCSKHKTILDLFLGSGSTLIACEQTNRTCYGMELDERYVDVIRKRYAKFTNNNELPENWEELTKEVS
jgi:DNA modification methylase